jgi:hypothetical protein
VVVVIQLEPPVAVAIPQQLTAEMPLQEQLTVVVVIPVDPIEVVAIPQQLTVEMPLQE